MHLRDQICESAECLGTPVVFIRQYADSAIAAARENLAAAGFDPDACGTGAELLRQGRLGLLPAPVADQLRRTQQDGVTDEEIVEWWDFSSLRRSAELELHNMIRGALMLECIDSLSRSQPNTDIRELGRLAGLKLRRRAIWFGNPAEPADWPAGDRYIPFEARRRVLAWYRENRPIAATDRSHESLNAKVRTWLRTGVSTQPALSARPVPAREVAPDHVWAFVKMHFDWEQYICARCAAMRIVKPDGSVVYKARGLFAWNPFSWPTSTPPPCKLDPRSAFARR